jgi:hypothetical protein
MLDELAKSETVQLAVVSLIAFTACFVPLVVCVTIAQIAWWILAPRERLIADGRSDDPEEGVETWRVESKER